MRSAQQKEWRVPGLGEGTPYQCGGALLSCNLSLNTSLLLDTLGTRIPIPLCGWEVQGDNGVGEELGAQV